MLIIHGEQICCFTHWNSFIEKDDSFFRRQSFHGIWNLHIDLKLHDLLQLANIYVITDMEAEEELANVFLVVDHLVVDGLDHNCEHWWMFESEIFKFYLSLGKRKEFLVVINTFAWIRCLSFNSDCCIVVDRRCSVESLGLTGVRNLKRGPRICLLLLHWTSLPIRLAIFVWNLRLLSLVVILVNFSVINWLTSGSFLQSLGQLFVWVLILGTLRIIWRTHLLSIFSYCTLTLFRLLQILCTFLLFGFQVVSIWIILRRFVQLVDTQTPAFFLLFWVCFGGISRIWRRFWDGVLTRRKAQVSLIFFVFFKLLLFNKCSSTFLSWGSLREHLLGHWLVTLCHLLHI